MDIEKLSETTEKRLKISKDVVEKICELALSDVGEEIYAQSKVVFTDLFGKRSEHKADVAFVGDSAEISISITIPEGVKAAFVAEKIQKKIIGDVRSMAGITVSKVNVTIAGLTPAITAKETA
jgi:uncharacterized alkaline shock family protein YloU